jgi:hypothetical protein
VVNLQAYAMKPTSIHRIHGDIDNILGMRFVPLPSTSSFCPILGEYDTIVSRSVWTI